jgi:hypothetical protein
MTLSPKEKAKELVYSYLTASFGTIEEYVPVPYVFAKQCALIAIENEYNSNRELLFNLRASKVIESEKVYLIRVQGLIDEEQEVKNEIVLL